MQKEKKKDVTTIKTFVMRFAKFLSVINSFFLRNELDITYFSRFEDWRVKISPVLSFFLLVICTSCRSFHSTI